MYTSTLDLGNFLLATVWDRSINTDMQFNQIWVIKLSSTENEKYDRWCESQFLKKYSAFLFLSALKKVEL